MGAFRRTWGLRLNSFFERIIHSFEREKEFQPFFSSLPIQQTNTKNVVVKGQGSRFQHNGGHPQEDAADEEGEGGVRRQSREGRGEDEGAPGKSQGARRRDQLFEQEDSTS